MGSPSSENIKALRGLHRHRARFATSMRWGEGSGAPAAFNPEHAEGAKTNGGCCLGTIWEEGSDRRGVRPSGSHPNASLLSAFFACSGGVNGYVLEVHDSSSYLTRRSSALYQVGHRRAHMATDADRGLGPRRAGGAGEEQMDDKVFRKIVKRVVR